MEMENQYDWSFSVPGESLQAHFVNRTADGASRFDATLSLKRRDLSGPALSRVLLVYPLMTLKVITMIYWQALRLVLKRAPTYVHPAKRVKP
jgi:DUF1365 family protein